jgi:hypothetical protein
LRVWRLKYIVDIPPDLAKKVDTLIIQGRYSSLSQFANVAFQNQLIIEDSPKELLENLVDQSQSKQTLRNENAVMDLSLNYKPEEIKTVSPPEKERIPNDCLWGQYNRLFPVKVTLRALSNLLKNEEMIKLETLHAQAVAAARQIGLALKKDDKKSKRKYGDMLSSALPIGRSIDKTEKRFVTQFVGYPTRAGRIEGAPGALGFLNIVEDEEGHPMVGITEAGLKFASLANPVLDEGNCTRTLSKEESAFYIKHTFNNLEREKMINILILSSLKQGKNSPSEFNIAVSPLSRGWSDSMVNTIRAGAVSRLNELGLISRVRKGTAICYALSDFGNEVLQTYKSGGKDCV